MRIVCTGENPPDSFSKSIFLAGPTPRTADVKSWRPEALAILAKAGYDGAVFVPENRNGSARASYDDQVGWEHKCLDTADVVLFWVPRKIDTLPGFTTNVEFGLYADSGRVVLGAPSDADKMEYLRFVARKFYVPYFTTLEETISETLRRLGNGALRQGAACQVPLIIWNTSAFQSWYRAQIAAGNRLDGARINFTLRKGPEGRWIYAWGLWVNVFVAKENRHKYNETVIARSNISAAVMYYNDPNDWLNSKVVLVREFRSPAATADGFIWEVPSGSSFKPGILPEEIAADEVFEETGLRLEASRFSFCGARQLAGTFSAHSANVFSAELKEKELRWLESQQGIVHGLNTEGETGERTYVEVRTLRAILSEKLVDWSNLGMILSVLQPAS